MAVVLEDGQGLSDANTLAMRGTVDTFWADRGGNATWTALNDTQKDARVVISTDYLLTNARYKRIRGRKKLATQRLMFPRIDCTERDGQAIADDVVPTAWVEAVCLLAPIATSLATLLPTLARGGQVTSESLTGVGSRTYAQGAPVGSVIQYIDGILAPFLIDDGFDMSEFDTSRAMSGVSPLPAVFGSDYFGSGAVDDASATEE